MFHQYKLSSIFNSLFDKDLGTKAKTRSTTWYSQFFMNQYNNLRWVEHFKVTKEFAFQLTMKLKYLIEKQNIYYKCAIPIGIQIECSFNKFAHGTKYFQCNELFAINKSTIHLVL
jgi:hypothetical protein